MANKKEFEVERKNLDTVRVASIRWRGKYGDCGERLSALFKKMGRYSCGKPMNLYYDEGYKNEDADIETCIPIREGKEIEGISIRTIEGGPGLALIHKGPYDQLSESYERLTNYAKEHGLAIKGPGREVYIKGPGMIFKGNPKKYLTEIQFPLVEKS